MKCLIVLSALVAFSAAALISPFGYSGLPLAYSGLSPYSFGYNTIAATPYFGSNIVSAPIARAVVSAPAVVSTPAVVAAPALAGVKSQYHSQDELGQASYGHSEPSQTHNAVQDAAGNKVGSFSYVSPDGRLLRTDYVADAAGYRVASNALPVGPGAGPLPVVDTPEVVAARAAHLAVHARARRDVFAIGHTPAATAPLATAVAAPVAYTAPITYASQYPLAYSSYAYSPVASTGLVRDATLTTVVNNPGHAISYRVD